MSYQNVAWAYGFSHIQPLEKFVLVTLSDRSGARGETGLPLIDLYELPHIAKGCNMELEKFEKVLEQLLRRGLARTAPGPSFELCTFIDPNEWNDKKKPAEVVASADGKRRKK